MIEFEVKDMTCSHCVGTIKRVINETVPGMPVDIDLDRHLVRVGDGAQADTIARAIREVGYTPVMRG